VIRVRVISRSPVVKAGLEAILAPRFEVADGPADVYVSDDPEAEHGEDALVVALTDDMSDAPALLRAGARAVLPGDVSAQELAGAVEAVVAGLVAVHADGADALFAPVRERATVALTPRETEVLKMIAAGLANKEIAWRLGITEHTVKFHVASLLTKLNAGSRTEAVTIGIRQGFVAV